MLKVKREEEIRRAYYEEGKSMRQIGEELGHSYWTIRRVVDRIEPRSYRQRRPKTSPVLGPYKGRIEELLDESEKLPRKQRYTGHKLYELLKEEGYKGSESGLRHYLSRMKKERKRPSVYIPLSFEAGVDAQVDWGEGTVILCEEPAQVQLFVFRLCYSRKIFVQAYPNQKQESFFAGHVAAFHHIGGVPKRIIYDNLKTAVYKVLSGRGREEQESFVQFRSHYLFESRYCNPRAGNEKGQVEDGVGYSRRNFMVPLLKGESYEEINLQLARLCEEDDGRRVDRQPQSIGEMWKAEQGKLRGLPPDYECCRSYEVKLNRYSQVVFETNRYSVPVESARKDLVLKAYPFHVEIRTSKVWLTRHERCYGREQDILNPLHYLPLLAERPGAFEHAKPMREWRSEWPPVYEELLDHLRSKAEGEDLHQRESRAVRGLIKILMLHNEQPADLVEQAIKEALADGIAHLEGVTFCLNRLLDPTPITVPLPLEERPELQQIGTQPLDPERYNQLLGGTHES